MRKSLTITIILAFLISSGCASIQYFGDSHTPTDKVEIFYDEKDVPRDYKVIGHAVGEGQLKNVRSKLIQRAEQEGAEGIIFKGFQPDADFVGRYYSGNDNNKIGASFIIYQ